MHKESCIKDIKKAALPQMYDDGGAYGDLKTIHSSKAPCTALRKGKKQIKTNPGGFILNYDHEEPLNLPATINTFMDRSVRMGFNHDVLLFDHHKFITALRFKIK